MTIQKDKVFEQIKRITKHIPKGKVTSYGQVAKRAGVKDARIVGWALQGNQDPNIPCHRVVKKNGFLAKNYSLGGWQEQKRRLVKEGVNFTAKRQVEKKHIWRLPQT